MKQTKYIFAAALAVLALGCNKEQVAVDGTPDGEEVGVTFTAELPGMQTKAIGDGLTAKNLIVEVYEDETGAAGTHIAALHQTATFTALKADVKFSLVKGKTYHFIFWAQADNAPYTLDAAAKTVAISYAGEANDESRDAFYAVKTLKVQGPATEPVQLKRPFAQVNFGTADFDDAKAGGVEVTQSSFTATDAATSLDLFAGEGVGSTDITYTEKELPAETLTLKDGTTYKYMAMNYFVPTGKFAESHVSNVKAHFVSASHTVEISSPSTPVQSNWRTNIVGNLLTDQVVFNVEIVPAFEQPDEDIDLQNISKLSALKALFANGGTAKLVEDITIDETLAVPAGKEVILDLNGHEINNAEDLWNETTGDWSLVSVRGGSLTIKGDGLLKAKENDCFAVDVQDGGHVIIEDGEYISNVHAVYVWVGTAEIRGGKYSVQQKFSDPTKADEFVLNCYDANHRDGTAKIIVTGGEFVSFNPADCWAEGAHTNFLAQGYKSVKNGNVYSVILSNLYTVASQQDFDDAVTAINASTDTDIKLTLDANVEWATGNAGDGANTIFTNTAAVVDFDLNGHSVTATGMGGFKSAAKVNFHNGTIIDETAYSSENGETAWEFTYLEFEGAAMSFKGVIFNNTVMFCTAMTTAEACTFKGLSTLASNNPNEYALWISSSAKLSDCKFIDLYRGVKIFKGYGDVPSPYSVEIDGCAFENISKKSGVVINAKTYAGIDAFDSVTISNCTFKNVQAGSQSEYVYETDNLVPVTSNNQLL